MSQSKEMWSKWAPLWDFMENQYMSTYIADEIIDKISSPVLIIGAGQGLLIKYLSDKGYIVDGIDLDEEMIAFAKKRHSINIIKADASKLPFKDKVYKTVIISSGVADQITDEKLIKKIIIEAIRVTSLYGNIFIAFYQANPVLEKVYKKIGIIDKEGIYHQKRLFTIEEIIKGNPLDAVKPIMQWTNKSFFRVMYEWTIMGLTLPKELKEKQQEKIDIDKKANELNINPNELYDCLPEILPYKGIKEVKNLFLKFGLNFNEIKRYKECIIVSIYKSVIYNINQTKNNFFKNQKSIVKITNLIKKYKGSNINAVDSININIPNGIIYGLLGPNGAGKTTTLSMICGLIKPTAGKILFYENQVFKNIKKKIGVIPQDLALYPKLTAKENLYFFADIYGLTNKDKKIKTDELLKLVGLENKKNVFVRKFSTGMKRRLNLAIGLINDPEIILMDEPTVGIDPQSRNCIFESILSLKKSNKTIIYTTHYMEEADKLCDHIAIIDKGSIILEGNPKKLIVDYGFNKLNFKIESKNSNNFYKSILNLKSVYDLHIKNNEFLVTYKGTNNIEIIEEIKNLSKKNKIKISLLNIIEPDLESLFLDITGRNIRDASIC